MDKAKLKELKEHGHYYSVPRGVSMHPMLKNTESIVDIVPFKGKLKKYDTALYYNKDRHMYVLHRVLGVTNTHYIFYGDNCFTEEIVPFEDVIGAASRFKRDSKSEWISVKDIRYLLYVHLWCDFLPLRRFILWLRNEIHRKRLEPLQNKAAYDIIYLIACEINNIKPELSQLAVKDLQNHYSVSRFHNLTNIVYCALESAYKKNLPKSEIIETWREEKDKSIRKNILLDTERIELFSWCEKAGILHAPLKGAVLKDLYPGAGMRQMSDIDILFDAKYSKQITDWFLAKHYEISNDEESDEHLCCYKAPVYNFEMHSTLFTKGFNPHWSDYYRHILDKLKQDEKTRYCYHFSDEDFYIYFIAHTYKHYKMAGTGLRSLLDCYVFWTANKNNLDYAYINKELSTLGILEFEQKVKHLAMTLFSCPRHIDEKTLSSNERKMLHYFITSGTYGIRKHHLKNMTAARLQKINPHGKGICLCSKLCYIKNKLLPDNETMQKWCKIHAPVFLQYKYLRPLAPLYRILKKDVTRFEWVSELITVMTAK